MVQAVAPVDYESMSRDEIKENLIALAEKHIAARTTYKSIRSDAAKGIEIWQGNDNGVALTVCTMKAEGLTKEDFEEFQNPDKFPANAGILDPILSARKMDENIGEGCYLMYQHIKTPMMVSNRCCFLAVYQGRREDGSAFHLTTSKGNAAIEAANTALIGKDVLSHTTLTY